MTDTGPVIIKIIARADGVLVPASGQYLVEFDFEANNGQGDLVDYSPDPSKAKQFQDNLEAYVFWMTIPKCKPTRPWDGRQNRPLTATHIEITPLAEALRTFN